MNWFNEVISNKLFILEKEYVGMKPTYKSFEY